MAYGAEVKAESTSYRLNFTYTPNNITGDLNMSFSTPASTEAQRDVIFQGFLTRFAGLAGIVINSATKSGGYSVPVTP